MRALLVAFAVIFVVSAVNAQDETAPPNSADLLAAVSRAADDLADDLTNLDDAIANSATSIEEGREILDQMLESVTGVNEELSEESEIWLRLDSLLTTWSDKERQARERSATDSRWAERADRWSVRIAEARKLRQQITTQRAETRSLIGRLNADRDLILEDYQLGAADKAVEALQSVSGRLSKLNDSLKGMVDQAQIISDQEVVQN